GQVWLLDAEPGARTCHVRALPIHAERSVDGKDWAVHEISGSHALDRLLLWSGPPRVYDVPSGEVAADLRRIPGRALCLSPDGRWVLCLGETSGGMMDLAAPDPAWRETTAFHVRRRENGDWEEVYLDHVDCIVALPGEQDVQPDDAFWITAGCYGFVSTHLVNVDRLRREVYPTAGESRDFGDFVYDPTEVLRQPGQRHVFVWHGYGVGLAALDPATGEFHHCWIRGRAQQPYGFISGVVPCGTAPIAWGHSRDGDFLWRVGEPPVMMPEPPGTVIAVYPTPSSARRTRVMHCSGAIFPARGEWLSGSKRGERRDQAQSS
ncbi:MAG TPA: hypothetical protein VHG93_06100, partial [Longimicrobium sp.]|nr:hypothetical protein [Longimicrobium sp.]